VTYEYISSYLNLFTIQNLLFRTKSPQKTVFVISNSIYSSQIKAEFYYVYFIRTLISLRPQTSEFIGLIHHVNQHIGISQTYHPSEINTMLNT